MATQLSDIIDYKSSTLGERAVNSAITSSFGNENQVGKFNDINTNAALAPKGSGIIDVVNDFDWNANHVLNAYPKMPKIFMTEREQVESSLISSYFYYTSNIVRVINNIGTSSGETIIDTIREFVLKQARGAGTGIDGLIGGTGASTSITKFINFASTVLNEVNTLGENDKAVLGEYLKSYIGIYLTRPTGFTYVLPWFDDSFQGATNAWSKLDRATPLHNIIDTAANAVMPYFKPGVYIERPKYFEFQDSGNEKITVNFPLLNTVSETYKKNYEFLWILAFQNKYYRESFASVRPPKIYTVQIPGVKYFPYAYISNLKIDFVGTRRLLEVETPVGTVQAPVPDAYQVSMEITSLLSDSSNMLLSDQFYKQIKTSVV